MSSRSISNRYNVDGIGNAVIRAKATVSDHYRSTSSGASETISVCETCRYLLQVDRCLIGACNEALHRLRGLGVDIRLLLLQAQSSGSMLCYFMLYYLRVHWQYDWNSSAKARVPAIAGRDETSSSIALRSPLPEQHRIVAEIETQFTRLEAGVAALKRAQANLRRYKAAVLKAACEGRLVPTEAELARAEGRDYEPADVLLQRILAERRAKWEAENPGKRYKEPAAPTRPTCRSCRRGGCGRQLEHGASAADRHYGSHYEHSFRFHRDRASLF